MPINKNEITKEMILKAMQCQDADELMALVKCSGVDITREEAEAYLAEVSDYELDSTELKKVAGGDCYGHVEPLCDGINCKNDGS